METIKIIGALITLTGSFFILFAAIGLIRMPDVYNRIQAGTKASTLGSIMTLFGIGIMEPEWMLKIIVLIIFILLSNPVSSHVLGRAAHHIRIPLSVRTVADQLDEDEDKGDDEVVETKKEDIS